VDDQGVVHGVRAGTASVRAAAGDLDGVTRVTVTLPEVAEPPALDRSTVAFSVRMGGGAPGAESVDVGGPPAVGRTLVAQVDYPSGGQDGWLTAALEGDTPPTRLRVRADRPPSGPGTYRASVVVGWSEGGPADTVGVTLEVARAAPPPDPPAEDGPTRVEADSLVWRQLFLLGDYPSAATNRAVKDTTDMVWRNTSLPDDIRARAAYAYAQAAVLLGEMDTALRWAQRAVDLAPYDRNYSQYLESLRGGGAP
jgi:hypothetical protein